MSALAVTTIWPESPMIECDCWVCSVSPWLTGKLWESNESIARKCRHSSSRDVTTEEPRRWSRAVRVTMADIHGQHWQMICGNYQRILCIVCFHITSVESNTQRGWRGEATSATLLWNNWIDSVQARQGQNPKLKRQKYGKKRTPWCSPWFNPVQPQLPDLPFLAVHLFLLSFVRKQL